MKLSSLFLGLLSVLLVGSTNSNGQVGNTNSTKEKPLIDLVKQMTEAQANFDAVTLEKIYASDYMEVSPIGEVDPREKAIGFYKAAPTGDMSASKMNVTADEFVIRTYKDFALVIARFSFIPSGKASGAPINFRATVVCRKEKGIWKIASVQATGIKPPRPPSTK